MENLADEPRFLDRLGVYNTDLPFIGVPIRIGETGPPAGVLAAQPPWREQLAEQARFLDMVANLIGLSRFLDGAQLRTAYARNYSIDYQNSRSQRTGNSRSDEFRPLFSVRGRLKNGTDTDLRFERRTSERRKGKDRRETVRFGDVLGRRSGVERRLSWKRVADKELEVAN